MLVQVLTDLFKLHIYMFLQLSRKSYYQDVNTFQLFACDWSLVL